MLVQGMRFAALPVLMAAAIALAGCGDVKGTAGAKGEQGPAGPAGPPGPAGAPGKDGGSIRTVTSNSCSANGCPSACAAGETLVSALCIGNGTARFSDTIAVTGGVMTAKCGPTSNSIVVSCARN